MAENADSVFADDLSACFGELKRHSVSYKLGQSQQTAGDEMQNPLHKQFSIILTKIEELFNKQNKESEEYVKILSMKASIIYEKAKILLTENLLTESKILLEEALELTKEYAGHPKVAFLYMRIVNHLTYVLSRLGDLVKAKELLLKAVEDEEKCSPEVFSTDDLFLNTKKDPKISSAKLNRLNINNMQMLAWIYARLGDIYQNIKIQHDILQKQLDLAEGDVLRWAESCFRLAGMFVGQNDWQNAVYHLAAAEAVLNPLEASLIPNPEVYAVQADLARSWVYYGLQLFEYSRKIKCVLDQENDDLEAKATSSAENLKPLLEFQGLDVEIPVTLPITNIENIQEARILFAIMQKWIKRARLYYTLRDYPLQYVNLCLDLSELYRFVSFYEEDIDAQYAVQKKRYDALESLSVILKEVRPNCYVAVNVELTKELIEVQMELMNLNLKKLYTPSQVPKLDVNNDVLRRQMNAYSTLHYKLENVTSTLNTSTTTALDSKKHNRDTEKIEEKPLIEQETES